MAREFLTQVAIDAPVATAWGVLTDFDRFGAWCPTLRAIHGRPVRGTRLGLRLATDAGGEKTVGLTAVVRVVDEPRELAWGGGVPGMPWLLDVHHWFQLEARGDSGCVLHHGERFRGALLGLLWPLVARRVEAGYPAFNEAFKRRCEERASAAGGED